MNIFLELRKQGNLASKRNPVFEKSKTAKIWIYIGVAFWACYLLFFGVTLGTAFRGEHIYRNQLISILATIPFILVIDFLIRFPFQQTPTQEVKPYLLLPVHKQRIIDFLLLRSGLDTFNLFWFFFFVPFAGFTVIGHFGILSFFSYLICVWLLIIINNYWFLLCRTLINEHLVWALLPLAFYGGIITLVFLPDKFPATNMLLNVGEGYLNFNLLYIIPTIAIIALLWVINSKVMGKLIYKEVNRTEDTKIKHLSEYKFLDRYGLLGEFFRLELKMLLRNKATKVTMRMIIIIVILFCSIMSFTPVYNDAFGRYFVTTYAFCALATTLLQRIMSFEGNYIDGLMVRKECILTLLKAKFYLAMLFIIIPFCLLIPAIVNGKITLLFVLAVGLFSAGAVHFLLFQLAVYNTETVPLNSKVTSRQSSSSIQKIITFVSLLAPMGIFPLVEWACGPTIGDSIMLAIGVGFILTSNIWLRNIYKRFMARRFANMDSFRNSR
jgi:hypothetical protein